jgi:hypothetical protein
MGRELFLFTNSKHYCIPDLFKTVGPCKEYIIRHHYKTQHNKEKCGMFTLCDKLCELGRFHPVIGPKALRESKGIALLYF